MRLALLAALLSAAPLAAPAGAAPIETGSLYRIENREGGVFTPTPAGGDSNGWYTDLTIRVDGATQGVSAGLFVLDRAGFGTAGPWSTLDAFCLQPEVFLVPFSNPYLATSLAGSRFDASGLVSELWGRFRASVVDDASAAAFQVALWELAYRETDRNLDTGAFRLASTSAAVRTRAQGWIDALDGTGPRADDLVVLVSDPRSADRQDLLTTGRVPAPASIGLTALGLGALLGVRALRIRRAG
ncbi:MAG TPA: hypothetical protein VEA81_03425 [Burkholderiaceae bacterium]|nr:hypothetical protein [Burkholderiaceae bacterium]